MDMGNIWMRIYMEENLGIVMEYFVIVILIFKFFVQKDIGYPDLNKEYLMGKDYE